VRVALAAGVAALAALVVTASTATAALPTRVRSQPCAVPDALLQVGEEKQARAAYVALLRRRPQLSCASEGLKTINSPAAEKPSVCAQADRKFDRGDIAGARVAYEQLGSDTKCAETGIAAVREVQRLCAQGKAERRLHRTDDARKAFEAALEKNPNARCAQHGIDSTRPFWLTRTLNAAPDVITEVAVALGILLAIGFLVLLFGYIPRVYRRLVRFPIAGRVLSPRLSLGPLDDGALGDSKIGAAFAAQIKERLQRYREEALRADAPDYDLDFDTARDEFADLVSDSGALSKSLEKARDVSDHTKVVGALVDLLHAALPIPRLTVTGVCDPPARAGAAATLSLENNAKLKAAVRLTGPPLTTDPTGADYLRLAQPSAVWVQYEVARVLGGRKLPPNAAESYALVREGLDRQLDGLIDAAQKAYEQALQLNPRNWAALVNLAVLEARRQGDYAHSTTILAEALDEMRTS
jgi:tetratricopeptide (TPR) repeat protein